MNTEESHEPVELDPEKQGSEEAAEESQTDEVAENHGSEAAEAVAAAPSSETDAVESPESATAESPVEPAAAESPVEPAAAESPVKPGATESPVEPAAEKPATKRKAAKRKSKTAAKASAKTAAKASAKTVAKAAAKTAAKAAAKTATKADTTNGQTQAVDDAAEGEAEPGLPMKWYVVHTYSGHENKVKDNILKMIHGSAIDEQFGRLIVPTEEVAEMKKGKKTVTTRKFFPSYILIEMFMSDESWHLVNGIPGVTSFVGTGIKPRPLLPNEVERILGRMDKDKQTIIPEIPYTLGEHIRIKDGPFSDFTGVIDEINVERGKLRVLVSIFGRETPVELDFLQVETL